MAERAFPLGTWGGLPHLVPYSSLGTALTLRQGLTPLPTIFLMRYSSRLSMEPVNPQVL